VWQNRKGELTTPKGVCSEQEEGGTGYHFHAAVDSCCKEPSVCALFKKSELCGLQRVEVTYRNTQVQENGWGVVVNSIPLSKVSDGFPGEGQTTYVPVIYSS
jgi:hypothetical protein